jgi:glycosyltransferase involved in cell wall biosynthesis
MGSLVVFSDDWGRHPSSCQHLVKQLLGKYEVLWINTIGTRTPKFDRATFTRILSKVVQWSNLSRREPANGSPLVQVRSPLMWPWFGRPIDRWMNQQVLGRAVARAVSCLPRPRTVVTTIPLVNDLVGRLDVDRWIYYCVDDLSAWPGLDGATLQRMERELVGKVDGCVAVSEFLQHRLAGMGRESTLLTHGVDLDSWREERGGRLPEVLSGAPSPRIVFWGLIDDRLDAEWLLQLGDQMPAGTIVLAGPTQSPNPRLLEHPRIQLIGPVAYSELPSLAHGASALVMPYRRMPATMAMQPLKLKEYLATGLPCVVSRLPATEAWKDSLDVVENSTEFVETVMRRAAAPLIESQSIARQSLVNESWATKAEQFDNVIESTFANCRT